MLVQRRLGEHGVEHDDGRDAQLVEQVDHIGAVTSAEDAVLVLDDRHIALVHGCRCLPSRAGLGDHQLVGDMGDDGLGLVDDAHHLDVDP